MKIKIDVMLPCLFCLGILFGAFLLDDRNSWGFAFGIGIYLLIGYGWIKHYLVTVYGKDSEYSALRWYWLMLPGWIIIADAFVVDEKAEEYAARFNQDNRGE